MTAPTSKYKVRIQIAVFHVLVAEVIVENMREADHLWFAWNARCHKLGRPAGGACIQRADIKRLWNIPVGATIEVK